MGHEPMYVVLRDEESFCRLPSMTTFVHKTFPMVQDVRPKIPMAIACVWVEFVWVEKQWDEECVQVHDVRMEKYAVRTMIARVKYVIR